MLLLAWRRDVCDYGEIQVHRVLAAIRRFYRYVVPALWAFLVGNRVTIAVAFAFDKLVHLKTDEELIAWVNRAITSGLEGNKQESHQGRSNSKWPKSALWKSRKHQSTSALLSSRHHDTSESERDVKKKNSASSLLPYSSSSSRNDLISNKKTRTHTHYSSDTDVDAEEDRMFTSGAAKSEGQSRSRSSTATSGGEELIAGLKSADSSKSLSNSNKVSTTTSSSNVGKRAITKITMGPMWADGRLLCRLMNALNPGTCPRPDLLDSRQPTANVALALKLARRYLQREPVLKVDHVLKLRSVGLNAIRAKNYLRQFLLELKEATDEASSLNSENESALLSASDTEIVPTSDVVNSNSTISEDGHHNEEENDSFLEEDAASADGMNDLTKDGGVSKRKRSVEKPNNERSSEATHHKGRKKVTSSPFKKNQRSTSEQAFHSPRPQLQRQSSSTSLHHSSHSTASGNRQQPPNYISVDGLGLKHAEQYKKAEFVVRYCGDELVTPMVASTPASATATALISASFLADFINNNNNNAKLNGAGDFTKNLDLLIDVKGPPPGHDFCTERLTRRSPRKKPRLVGCPDDSMDESPSSALSTSSVHPQDRPSMWRRQTFSNFSTLLGRSRRRTPSSAASTDTDGTAHVAAAEIYSSMSSSSSAPHPYPRHRGDRWSTSAVPTLSTIPYEYEILSKRVVFRYTPQSSGNHWVSIYWQGRHVMGSPFVVNAVAAASSAVSVNTRRRQNSEQADPSRMKDTAAAAALATLRQQWDDGARVDLATALRRERFKNHRNAVSSLDVLELQSRNNKYEYTANWIREEASPRALARVDSEEVVDNIGDDKSTPAPGVSAKRRKRNIFAESRDFLKSRASLSMDENGPTASITRIKPLLLRQDSDESVFLRRRMAAEWSNQNLRRNSWTTTHHLGNSSEGSTLLSAAAGRLLTPLRGKRVLRRTAILDGQEQIELDPREGDVDPAELAAILVRQLSHSKSTSIPTDNEDDIDDDVKEDEVENEEDEEEDDDENDSEEERRQRLTDQLDWQQRLPELKTHAQLGLRDDSTLADDQLRKLTTSVDEKSTEHVLARIASEDDERELSPASGTMKRNNVTPESARGQCKIGDILPGHTAASMEELTDHFDIDEAPLSILPSTAMMHERRILDPRKLRHDAEDEELDGVELPAASETTDDTTTPVMLAEAVLFSPTRDAHASAAADPTFQHQSTSKIAAATINDVHNTHVERSTTTLSDEGHSTAGPLLLIEPLSTLQPMRETQESMKPAAAALSCDKNSSGPTTIRGACFKRRLTRQKALDPAASGDDDDDDDECQRRIDEEYSVDMSQEEEEIKVLPSVKSLSSKFESLSSADCKLTLLLERSSSVKSIGFAHAKHDPTIGPAEVCRGNARLGSRLKLARSNPDFTAHADVGDAFSVGTNTQAAAACTSHDDLMQVGGNVTAVDTCSSEDGEHESKASLPASETNKMSVPKGEDLMGMDNPGIKGMDEERPTVPSFSSIMAAWKAKDALMRSKRAESDH